MKKRIGKIDYEEAIKVLFGKLSIIKLVHLKPLYLWANIEVIDIGRVFIDNDVTINILPLCMLEVIWKIMEDLTSTKVVINGFSR